MDDTSRIGANVNGAAANKIAFAKKIDDFAWYLKEFFDEMNNIRGEFVTTPDRTTNVHKIMEGLDQRRDLINVVLSKRMLNPTRPIDKYLKKLFLKRPWMKEYFADDVIYDGYRTYCKLEGTGFYSLNLENFFKLSNYSEREFIKATDVQCLISSKQYDRLKLYERRSRIKPLKTKVKRFKDVRAAIGKLAKKNVKKSGPLNRALKILGKMAKWLR